MKRLESTVIIFFITLVELMAQQLIFNENRLKMRVKQMDEFEARFNYEQDLEGRSILDSTNNIEMRKKYVLSLFDENLFEQNLSDSILNLYNDFLNSVVNEKNPIYIRFTDADWIAHVECNVTLNGRPEKIFISLQTEKIKKYEYKWVIIGAKGSVLALTPTKSNPGIMISPVDNELNFMNLQNITGTNNKDVINYSFSGYETDQLTVLNTLIYTGQLKILNAQKVVYYYFQVPDYIFKVEHFERDSDNVGWLIAEIINVKNKKKKEFWHKLLSE